MIWNAELETVTSQNQIATRIVEEAGAVCGHGNAVGDLLLWEAASGVAAYVDERASRGSTAEPRELLRLTSQALDACGENCMARRLLVLGTGLVRPAVWSVTGDTTVWVLDLTPLTRRGRDRLELVFFGSLNVVLETIADLWDASRGNGVLGLNHVSASAAALLGGLAGKRQITQLARELCLTCAGKLDHLRAQRGWRTAPIVMNLGT
jgi:hypothetical protein